MFDRKGFIAHVGGNSGASYANGLENIEKTYRVDINKEVEHDRCADLLKRIDGEKKQFTGNERKNRQNWYSHLKKYVEYRKAQPDEEQKENSMLKKIRFIIAHYKANFATVNEEERYKWEAIHWYQQHWNIDAPDFAKMLSTAFYKASNLLASGMYYPYRMITEYAEADPEAVRKLFKILHDESLPLEDRYQSFKQGFEIRIEQLMKTQPSRTKSLQHYQDLRAAMVYLTFQYPEKYYLYKATMYTKFRDRVGFAEPQIKNKTVSQRIKIYAQMCEVVLSEVRKDYELLSMHKSRLDDTCYQDEAYHLLTMDIIYYGAVHMSDDSFNGSENYWPSLEDYDPGITQGMWTTILQDSQVTTENTLRLLYMFVELGGESTLRNLEEHFDNQIACKEILQDFSTRVINKVNCAPCPGEYKDLARYIIPFVGRMVMEGDVKRESWKLREELLAALLEMNAPNTAEEQEDPMEAATDIGLNTILYGPPGTGKTYHTVIYAVAIIENKLLETVEAEAAGNYPAVLERYNRYKSQERIAFTTFHQSYGYEEFIEGIRPDTAGEEQEGSGEIRYCVQAGLFKAFCEKADRPAAVRTGALDLGIRENPTVWKVSLEGTGDNPTRAECLEKDHIRIGWDDYGKDITDETDFSKQGGRVVLNAFMNKMQPGDIVLSCYSASTIDAIGVVTGDYEWHPEYPRLKRLRKVKWLAKNIRENILPLNGNVPMTLASVYKLSNIAFSDVYSLIEKYQGQKPLPSGRKDNYVFIIDEINRGNISKIFGELITLIEESKRVGKEEGMTSVLPYSGKSFGVPGNVYIIGTMNTADRSIAAIDTALRRRFAFREMLPDPQVLSGISVGELSIGNMLTLMNRRIEVLYDREHTIGHGYFTALKKDNSLEMLADIFRNKVIPLLQEYFYEDYEKIRLILGDNQKREAAEQFILAQKVNQTELFGTGQTDLDESYTYTINEDAFLNPKAYLLK